MKYPNKNIQDAVNSLMKATDTMELLAAVRIRLSELIYCAKNADARIWHTDERDAIDSAMLAISDSRRELRRYDGVPFLDGSEWLSDKHKEALQLRKEGNGW